MDHDLPAPSDGLFRAGGSASRKADDGYLTVPVAVLVGFNIGFSLIGLCGWLGLERGPVAAGALGTIVVFLLASRRKQQNT